MASNTTTQIPIKNLYSLKKTLGACFQNCYLVFVIKQMHIYLFLTQSYDFYPSDKFQSSFSNKSNKIPICLKHHMTEIQQNCSRIILKITPRTCRV